ncbi:class I SAM-dependent methyltransferase [Campylobacter ureolyticus]|uniref:class I SAM-dependent methyltransferase n=1 Tax=Campylobacter ureolyticus TaxID=827 RepID=UPI0022B4A20E|nr:class I SAM-dependent methyltransferase [Campylobacter ureolyticus]MCZ6117222.1 class I SAM-dependent methyltransferase [Campylobacter ureolyticus]
MNVQNKNSNIKNSEIWDKKAKSYSKFDGNLNEFQIRFFKILKDFDVSFKDKTLVDIGCGTGIYSLYLAGICKMVLGVDSSTKMLEELNLKKAEFKINNLQTINSDFKNFQTADKFDIAFLTMSPALQNKDDFNKFMDLGNLRIYLNWEEFKISTMLEPFYKLYDRKTKDKNKAVILKNWLDENKIAYKTEILEEVRISNRTFDEAFENIVWHLEISDVKFDKNEIKNTLLKMQKDGFIEDVIKSKMRVLVF